MIWRLPSLPQAGAEHRVGAKGLRHKAGVQGRFLLTPALSPSEGERGNARQGSGEAELMDSECIAQVLIVSGTGSGCYGQGRNGMGVKVGGWGHVLGDKGSGYDIGLCALQGVIDAYDQEMAWPGLGRRLLRALQLNEPNDLIDWAQAADKTAIASLAAEVFAAWGRKDKLADRILAGAARSLARDAAACARRAGHAGHAGPVCPDGEHSAEAAALRGASWPRVAQALAEGSGHAAQARECLGGGRVGWTEYSSLKSEVRSPKTRPKSEVRRPKTEADVVRSARRSPTEERNPRSMKLDKMGLGEAIRLMLSEEGGVAKKLLKERRGIERGNRRDCAGVSARGAAVLCRGGHERAVGRAGCERVPAYVRHARRSWCRASSPAVRRALWDSVEGAEDDAEGGAHAVEFRGITRRDVVVGIAASGTTPFVWGALREAKRRGATTVLVCFNPFVQIPRAVRPAIVIAPNLGPEVLTGSTRLKAGTATKLLLNMFTTLAMVRLGKVRSNLMIDLNPANVKLRDRAVRIVRDLTRGGLCHGAAGAGAQRMGCQKGSRAARSETIARSLGKLPCR